MATIEHDKEAPQHVEAGPLAEGWRERHRRTAAADKLTVAELNATAFARLANLIDKQNVHFIHYCPCDRKMPVPEPG
ncbi:hypothetical protein Q5752_002255 [Cryptotrichosporon argae]